MFRPPLTLGENQKVRADSPPGTGNKRPPVHRKICNAHGPRVVTLLCHAIARARGGGEIHFDAIPVQGLDYRTDRQDLAHTHSLQPYPRALPAGWQWRDNAEAL